MPKAHRTILGQTQINFRVTDEPDARSSIGSANYWPTREKAPSGRKGRQEHYLASTALAAIENEDGAQAQPEANKVVVDVLIDNAIRLYPEEFGCLKDLTAELQHRINRMSRDGDAMPYSVAFEKVMGYPYLVFEGLGEDPQYSFKGKSPAYLTIASEIFKNPNPDAGHRRELYDLRDRLLSKQLTIHAQKLKGRFTIDDQPDDLAGFINWRVKGIDKLLRQ